MRLINVETEKFEEFVVSSSDTLKYTILSHTWGDDGEATFQDFKDPGSYLANKKGLDKIRTTCSLAKKDDIPYVWVDTCCIDKISSAELMEAINSMFNWYRDAQVCYVWLADLPAATEEPIDSSLKQCRWFTRGWTLQELLAPRNMKFYDRDWEFRGTKRDLKELIADAAQIGAEVLERPERIHRLPIAQRMSWAARRETTRPEDMAYCLLGLFEVNMPMLYGEGGTRAFIRLQEEIIKDTNDLSIFAWKTARPGPQKFHGIFANNPAEFRDCGAVQLSQGAAHDPEFALSNKGLRIQTDLTMVASDGAYLLELDCRIGLHPILIWLHHHGGGVYSRSRAYKYGEQRIAYNRRLLGQQRQKMMYIHKWLDAAQSVGFEVSHRYVFVLRRNCNVRLDDNDNTYEKRFMMFPFAVKRIEPAANWDAARNMLYTHGVNHFIGCAFFWPYSESSMGVANANHIGKLKQERQSFFIAFGRKPDEDRPWITINGGGEEYLLIRAQSGVLLRDILAQLGSGSCSRIFKHRGSLLKITATLEEGEFNGQCVYYIDLDMEKALKSRPDV